MWDAGDAPDTEDIMTTTTTTTIRHNGARVAVLPREEIARIAAAQQPEDLFLRAWALSGDDEDGTVALDLTDGTILTYTCPRNGYVRLSVPTLDLIAVRAGERSAEGWEASDLLAPDEYAAWVAEDEAELGDWLAARGDDLDERVYLAATDDGDTAWDRMPGSEEIAVALDSLYGAGQCGVCGDELRDDEIACCADCYSGR